METLLEKVLAGYPFKPLAKERFNEIYYLDYLNSNNCQGRFLLRVLNDSETLRLSITQQDDIYELNVIDLFEFDNFLRLDFFLKLVL